ncbi:DUF4412 domain-containing protein [Maribacter sp. ANRC-HE7]|uniref:DUF4412 domain-containing protein n=1 Tax=Maribacter aquimaris TaxID=2737171 RepID=A0ABR7V387_9FLAO|nr:DUF4412 domain-containing protein [Maribacter aquimaris]MBD0779274.1 DUF4412 domain-containing protein [Maribacter aquimaris]
MKKIAITVFFLLAFIGNVQQAEAQFFKKLKERVKEKAEYVVVEKTSDKVAEKASNSLDKAFEINPFSMGKGKADPTLVPDSYDFSWKYSLNMKTKDGDIVFHYFLQPGQPYFGFTTPLMESMFTVMDNGRKITVMYMQSEKSPAIMANSMPDDLDIEEANDESATFGYESLPDKEIMGYTCTGVKATNDRYEISMYFTADAPVSFNDIYKNQNKNIPAGLENYFGEDDYVLMLEMQMTDLKKKKRSATMECIGLEEVQRTIIKSDYNIR